MSIPAIEKLCGPVGRGHCRREGAECLAPLILRVDQPVHPVRLLAHHPRQHLEGEFGVRQIIQRPPPRQAVAIP